MKAIVTYKKPTKPAPMSRRFDTEYDSKRDPNYGCEYNPYTKKVDDCRDRD